MLSNCALGESKDLVANLLLLCSSVFGLLIPFLYFPYLAVTTPTSQWSLFVIVEFKPKDPLTLCFHILNAEEYETGKACTVVFEWTRVVQMIRYLHYLMIFTECFLMFLVH